jgi:carbonic anhydrase
MLAVSHARGAEFLNVSSIDDLLDHNAKYAAGFSKVSRTARPAKKIAIVTCMDARMDPGELLGLAEGDAHVIRNAGGVVTEDVIRSLMISQRVMGTREIMLIHHSGCGMSTITDAELSDDLEKETGVRPPFAIGAFSDVEDDVRQSIARINASPFVSHKDAIRGFLYDDETGRLREVK